YFAYSGLNTNIGALTDATSWGLTFLLILVACGGKVIGCGLAARLTKYNTRESLAIGFLMNTKGLVELIVLNLGYQAGVINQKVFTMFVIMALVTTFMTVPMVAAIYPLHMYENTIEERRMAEADEDSLAEKGVQGKLDVLLCIPNMETIPSVMAITQLLNSAGGKFRFRALRLIPLSDRASSLLMATTTDTIHTFQADPIFKVFQTFTQLTRVGVKTTVSVLPPAEFPTNIVAVSSNTDANIVLFPYVAGSGDQWKDLVEYVNAHTVCTTVMLIDRGFGGGEDHVEGDNLRLAKATPAQKVCVVFQGGTDDQEVLRLAYYVAKSRTVQINVLRIHPASASASAACTSSAETTEESTQSARLLAPLAPFPNVTVTDLAIPAAEDQAEVIARAGRGFAEGDLVILGRGLYDTCGGGSSRNLRGWAESECRASVLVVSAGPRGLGGRDSRLMTGDLGNAAGSSTETVISD
ncbi:MAG: Sodium/hydrogen exchanger family-domain-containing protein, partial [Olpidium bornovanus]